MDRANVSSTQLPWVVAIVGPTAVGKTDVAVGLCAATDAEIVSLDSRQMYRSLDIGTAKPSREDLDRAPHHLVDIVDPDDTLSLSGVQALANEAIADIAARGHLPIVAGGTGQYVRAVLEGWQVPQVAPDEALRTELQTQARQHGAAWLHERLAEIDPKSAERIDARNIRRVIRAIEVHHVTGEPISKLQGRKKPPFSSLIVGLTRSREALYERIDRRIDAMLAAGLEAEVRSLHARGYTFDLPAMSGVGYGEWQGVIDGTYDRDEAIRLIRHNTRRLVRSQMTWFRLDDARIEWFDLEERSPEAVVTEVIERLADATAPSSGKAKGT